MILAHSSHELERMVRCIYQNLLANPSSGTSNKIPEVREATFRQQVWGPSSLGVFFRNQVSLLADDGLDVTAWPNRCGLHTLKKSETSMKLSGIEPCRFETRNFKLAMQLFSRGSLMRACLKTHLVIRDVYQHGRPCKQSASRGWYSDLLIKARKPSIEAIAPWLLHHLRRLPHKRAHKHIRNVDSKILRNGPCVRNPYRRLRIIMIRKYKFAVSRFEGACRCSYVGNVSTKRGWDLHSCIAALRLASFLRRASVCLESF